MAAGGTPLEALRDQDQLAALLTELRRTVEAMRSNPYVNVGGVYRLSVDSLGRLVATHGPSGTVQVLMTPPP